MATTGAGRTAAADGASRFAAPGTGGLLLVLSFASGAVDALAVVALGGAFAGVMTGNLIFLGAAVAGRTPEGVWAPAAALCGYVLATALVASALRGAGPGRAGAGPGAWPGRVVAVFAAETAVLGAVALCWAAAGPEPAGWVQNLLVGALAAAMGAQASAVLALGPSGAPTTFFTSTLTTLVLHLATGRGTAASAWSAGRIGALLAGACCAVLVRRVAPQWAPALPAGVLAASLAAVLAARRAGRRARG